MPLENCRNSISLKLTKQRRAPNTIFSEECLYLPV
uniref:Uncharacterized protein n=1 Tax=Arundo donax TaxID=35708 RepID=A0A0A9BEG7_ARUDO